MKLKKHLALILTVAALCAFSFSGTANAINVWDGTTGTIPQPVNGVITITTGAQLAAFRNAVNNGNDYANYVIRLGDDINLNNIEWTPIGRFFNYPGYYLNPNPDNKAFSGIFDGAGHSITGLNVNNDNNNYNARGETAALFGYIDYPSNSKATMARSMTPADKAALDAAELGLTGEDYYRVLAERRDFYETFGVKPVPAETRSVTPSYAAKGRVKNLKVYGTVTNTEGQGAAGVVCWNDGVIENCYFEGTASCTGTGRAYVGGICSLLGDDAPTHNTYVVNCAAMVDAKAHGGSFSYAGGIAGYCYAMNRGYIVNCSVQPGSKIDSYMDTGGVVGGFAYKVYNCSSAASEVTVNGIIPNQAGHFAGGIVGAFGAATNCYWFKSTGSTLQPDYAVGNGTDTTGRKSTTAALPRASVLFGRKTIAVNGTAYAPKTTYPTGASANTLSYSGWNSSDSSVAGVNSSSGLVTGYSAGKAVISATATSSGSWWTATAPIASADVTPESMFTVTQ